MIDSVLSLPVGVLQSNIYFVQNGNGDSIMIDCGAYDKKVAYFIEKNDINVKAVLLTHGHFDHTMGLKIADNGLIDVFIGEKDEKLLFDDSLNLASYFNCEPPRPARYRTVKEGDYDVCGFKVKVIETPGHTEGSVAYLIEDRLFTGDTMFMNGFGRTDFPTGDADKLFDSIKKLLTLDKKVTVYPGHGERTTIAREAVFYSDMMQ